jgi:hypothetical protein
MVLEKSETNGRPAYGTVERDREGHIVFNHRKVEHLFELVNACLADYAEVTG